VKGKGLNLENRQFFSNFGKSEKCFEARI